MSQKTLRDFREELIQVDRLLEDARNVDRIQIPRITSGDHENRNVFGVSVGRDLALHVLATETRQRQIEIQRF